MEYCPHCHSLFMEAHHHPMLGAVCPFCHKRDPARIRRKRSKISKAKREKVIARDKGICHICKRPVRPGARSMDHLVPLSRGGSNAIGNLALAHRGCNMKRSSQALDRLDLDLVS